MITRDDGERESSPDLERACELLSEALACLDQGKHLLLAAHLSGVIDLAERERCARRN